MTKGTKIQRLLSRAETFLEIGSDAADVLVHLGSGATPAGAVSVGLRVVNSIRTATLRSANDYFLEWEALESWGYADTLFRVSEGHPSMHVVPGVESDVAYECEIHGVRIGWERYSERIYGPHVPKGADPDAAYVALGRLLWEHLGTNAVLTVEGHEGSAVPQFQTAVEGPALGSQQGREITERIQAFQQNGVHRSILLVGLPGTGKSCMMRFIAQQVGGFTLRIPTSDMEELTLRQIQGAVRILRPNVVEIDDFDRFCTRYGRDMGEVSFALDAIEYIASIAEVLLVSANLSKDFPEALMRPGRLDEVEIVDEMDPEVVDALIGEVKPSLRKKLGKMPVAFIVEFARRRETLGPERAFGELAELEDRIAGVERRRRRAQRRTGRATTKPKTHAQAASILERQAASLDLQAAKFKERAEARREKAAARREKAKAQPPKKTKKTKKKAKRKAKKKSKARGGNG